MYTRADTGGGDRGTVPPPENCPPPEQFRGGQLLKELPAFGSVKKKRIRNAAANCKTFVFLELPT